MKKFMSGRELAKDMGISEDKLQSVFEDYNQVAAGKKTDPFGKKFFSVGEWKMDDYFNVVSGLHTNISSCPFTKTFDGNYRLGWNQSCITPWVDWR